MSLLLRRLENCSNFLQTPWQEAIDTASKNCGNNWLNRLMNKMDSLETLLRSWKLRPPSVGLKARIFGPRRNSFELNGGEMGMLAVNWPWVTPVSIGALSCGLLFFSSTTSLP